MEEMIYEVGTILPILVGILAVCILGVFLAMAGKTHCRELVCFGKVDTPRTSLLFWHLDKV